MPKEYLYVGSVDDYLFDPSDYDSLEDDAPTVAECEMLKSIKTAADIKTFSTGAVYEDDHEACINMIINGAKFSAMWIVPEFLADVIYAGKGVESALEEVASYIQDLTEHT